MRKQKVIVLVGPTNVGKTKTSIEIAKTFGLEVISGDAYQVYQGMDIGTGKITQEEMCGIVHHMIDIVPPEQSFSVKEFQQRVREIVDDQHAQGNVPFIVGGTGLYIKAVLYDYTFESEDSEKKRDYVKQYETYPNDELYALILEKGIVGDVHPNNRRRMIRLLVRHAMGESLSPRHENTPLYDVLMIGLTSKRELLYEGINARVVEMVENGLVNEVKSLYSRFDMSTTARQAIGYKEFEAYLNDEISLEETIATIQQHSRNFAKRQLTFFRNQLPVQWYSVEELDMTALKTEIQHFLNKE